VELLTGIDGVSSRPVRKIVCWLNAALTLSGRWRVLGTRKSRAVILLLVLILAALLALFIVMTVAVVTIEGRRRSRFRRRRRRHTPVAGGATPHGYHTAQRRS
jgi:hypothetical protein